MNHAPIEVYLPPIHTWVIGELASFCQIFTNLNIIYKLIQVYSFTCYLQVTGLWHILVTGAISWLKNTKTIILFLMSFYTIPNLAKFPKKLSELVLCKIFNLSKLFFLSLGRNRNSWFRTLDFSYPKLPHKPKNTIWYRM